MTSIDLHTITKSAALEMLERAVAERGADFRYKVSYRGTYADYAIPTDVAEERGVPAGPACLVGVGLAARFHLSAEMLEALDESLPMLAGFDFGDYDPELVPSRFAKVGLVDLTESNLFGVAGLECTESAARVLWAAQICQDRDGSWGEALAFARQVAELLSEE